MSAMATQITGVSIVCSTVCSGADQRKYLTSEFPAQRASNAENVSFDGVIMNSFSHEKGFEKLVSTGPVPVISFINLNDMDKLAINSPHTERRQSSVQLFEHTWPSKHDITYHWQ